MKKLLFVLVILSFLISACGGARATATKLTKAPEATDTPVPPTQTPASEPSGKGKLETGQITSQALAENLIGDPATRDFNVYLPPGYDTSDKRYPVVYALHGFTSGIWAMAPMGPVLDSLIARGEAHKMILVFPDGGNKFQGSWYLSSPTIGDYESYIAREFVAYIDANYRTLPHRDSRGTTGCSMGGNGSLHLALKYPDVFSVVAPMSGAYDLEHHPRWEQAADAFRQEPRDFADFHRLTFQVRWAIAGAAAAAPNPNKPPFYLDMPFRVVDGKGEIVPDVWQKILAVDNVHDVRDYLNQPVRLRALMIYHGEYDSLASVEPVRGFDKMLTELGVEHEYVEVKRGGHSNLDYAPVLEFISDNLVNEMPE
jgi:enterochelin esterase-like enzyme